MRTLTEAELCAVSGGTGECTASDGGNTYGGVSDTKSFGDNLIDLYEGAIEAASYVIERVANAL